MRARALARRGEGAALFRLVQEEAHARRRACAHGRPLDLCKDPRCALLAATAQARRRPAPSWSRGWMCAGRVANDAGLRTLQGRERCWRHAARRVGAGRGLTRGAAAGPGAERVGGGGGGGAGAARAPPGAADARAGDVRGGAGARPGQLRAPGAARALSAKAETFPLPSSRSLFVSFPSLASLSLSRSVSLSPPQRASRPAPSRRRSGSSTQFCPSPRRSRRSPPRASMPPPRGSSRPTRARARARPRASASSARVRRRPSAAARWRRRCGSSSG